MWVVRSASASGCYACHAPLAEQRPFIRAGAGFEKNPDYDPTLADKGVPCAACHVRGHERFGPPRRDGSLDERVARRDLAQESWGDAHLGVPRLRVLPRVHRLRAERARPQRQAPSRHLRRVASEPVRASGSPVPGLPHA